jgi:hypothetical protein
VLRISLLPEAAVVEIVETLAVVAVLVVFSLERNLLF